MTTGEKHEMNETLKTRPVAAIIGRPNVGKSSIFNRLAGRRIAIVHEEPGITRDRIICTIRLKDRCFDLVDTGGLEDAETTGDKISIEGAVRRQVEIALREAKVIIFVVDIQTGITAADEKISSLLHKSGLPVMLVANKSDNAKMESCAPEFEKFGFPVFPVSALHNRGFMNLTDALVKILPPGTEEEISRRRVAIVGRPNVGKSLLVNRLLRSERVIVSSEPGTTRDSIAVPLIARLGSQEYGYMLIDTAGLRKAKKNKWPVDSLGQMRTTESIMSADIVALILDATQGPTSYDKNIAAQILDQNKACVIVVNKWDLIPAGSQPACRAALRHELPFMDFVPVVCASAATGFNTHRIMETINYVAQQNRKKIATGILNRGLEIAVARFQPPLVRGKRLKIFYATQTAVQPISFLLFVNDHSKIISSYEKYLKAALRKNFGFEGVPIVLKFRNRDSHNAGAARKPRGTLPATSAINPTINKRL